MTTPLFSRHFRQQLFTELTQTLLNNLESGSSYRVDMSGFRYIITINAVPKVSEIARSFTVAFRYGFRVSPLPSNVIGIKNNTGLSFIDEIDTGDQGVDPVKVESTVNKLLEIFYDRLAGLGHTESLITHPELKDLPTEFTIPKTELPAPTPKIEIPH